MKRLLAVVLALLLSSCATAPPPAPEATVLDDTLFAPPSEPVEASQLFALSDAMRHYLDVDLAAAVRTKGARAALVDALYRRGELRLEYDAAVTRNAAQAFEARSGNCLSLVIMTTALARHLGVPVQYHHVFVEETWGRSGDLLVSSGHVNLTLSSPMAERRARFDMVEAATIDFDPPLPGQRQHSRVIGESTVVAMFMNNRAAESLAAGRTDDAYWWARAAIGTEATFLAAHNTLAVVYLRRGALAQAERVLTRLLEVEPANVAALSNLAKTYAEQGRVAQAQAVLAQLARVEPVAPFHYFHAGVAALERRDYAQAKVLFEKEVARAAYYHEFHFGLAVALHGLGEFEAAQRQLALALQSSTRPVDRELYAGKLERLKASRLQ
ncbi:tetratricopeptide repeat protein [uncultured Piscinibacter sp.]|uniref:tetratricopeptide repeat protein n=1 Tax=uncultured Piscinibacter sp. TaxID=1131835 RepID=UPI00262F8A2B|nr:tetratricopeptide repeat protein [uncultured Piscinibacter sp.]